MALNKKEENQANRIIYFDANNVYKSQSIKK